MDSLNVFLAKIKKRASHYIGYPTAVDFDYTELFDLFKYSLNNIGDPFIDSHTDMHTRQFERESLQFFADLFHAPKDNWWGYITTGGTEGNLYGLYLAREMYPNAMVYYSESTHYSVQKNIHLLGMESIFIRAQENGEIDYEDLRQTIQYHRHQPAIIMANIGTTMTEAKDDLHKIKEILKSFAIKQHYIHCDAALAGVYLSLMGEGHFDFSNGSDSIAISGHKFIGSPIPFGVVLVKKSHKDRIGQSIPYIGTVDTTITGSRNAITPVFLWYAIKKMGREGLLARALEGIELAEYTVNKLLQVGVKAWRNPNALTVVFPQPSAMLCHKWQLASDNGHSHLICMPGVTRSHIDLFVKDMALEKSSELEAISPIEMRLN